MYPAERPYVAELSDEAKKIRLRLRTAIVHTIERCEAIALLAEKAEALKTEGLTKRRIEAVLAWFDDLAEGRAVIHAEMDDKVIAGLVNRLKGHFVALSEVRNHHLAPGEFLLDPESVPTWSALPSETEIKRFLHFEWIWLNSSSTRNGYNQGRPLSDFDLLAEHLALVGIIEPDKQRTILKELEQPDELYAWKIFDVSEEIRSKECNKGKQLSDPGYENYLTTKELYEAIDRAGYRPATFKEFLVCSQMCPKLARDLNDPFANRGMPGSANARPVYTLGSVFLNQLNVCKVPCIDWDDQGGRRLLMQDFQRNWSSGLFPVFRKRGF